MPVLQVVGQTLDDFRMIGGHVVQVDRILLVIEELILGAIIGTFVFQMSFHSPSTTAKASSSAFFSPSLATGPGPVRRQPAAASNPASRVGPASRGRRLCPWTLSGTGSG